MIKHRAFFLELLSNYSETVQNKNNKTNFLDRVFFYSLNLFEEFSKFKTLEQ